LQTVLTFSLNLTLFFYGLCLLSQVLLWPSNWSTCWPAP